MLQRFKKAITWIVLASMLLTNSIPSSMALADEYAEGSGYEQTVVEESTSETVTEPAGENQGGSAPVEQTEDPSTPENASSGDQNNADASNNQQDATPAVSENGNEPTQTEGTPATTTEGEAQNTEGTEGKTPDATEGDGVTEQPAEDEKKEEEPTGETQPAETPVEEPKQEEPPVQEEPKQEEPNEEDNPGQEETKKEETPTQTPETPAANGSQTPTESSTATESSVPAEESKVEAPAYDPTKELEEAIAKADVFLSGNWAEDLVTVARTQIPYTGTTVTDADGTVHNYNRYAAWYNASSPEEDWCTYFILFCLRNAEIPEAAVNYANGVQEWVGKLKTAAAFQESGAYQPKEGDLVFFVDEEELAATGSRVAGHVGIVSDLYPDEAGNVTSFYAIEGNNGNAADKFPYGMTDTKIFGFGVMPENPDLKEEEKQEEVPAEEKAEETVEVEEVQVTVAAETVEAFAAGPFAERMLMAAPMRGDGDGEGEHYPYYDEIAAEAERLYNPSTGVGNTILVTITGGPEDSAHVKAGDIFEYRIGYEFIEPAVWYTGYSQPMTLFDTYDNSTITVHLPEGLTITGDPEKVGWDHYTTTTNPSGGTDYTFYFNNMTATEAGFTFNVLVGNNGTNESLHTYTFGGDELTPMVTFDTYFQILDKYKTPYQKVGEPYHHQKTTYPDGFSTETTDLWGVEKEVAEAPSFNDAKTEVTFNWLIKVGFYEIEMVDDGEGGTKEVHHVITNIETYKLNGRDGITSFTLDDIISATCTNGIDVDDPILIKINKGTAASSDAVDITDRTDPLVVWGQNLTNEKLKLNTTQVNSGGVTDDPAPSYTTYYVQTVYEVTPEMLADFSENTFYTLTAQNTVSTKARLAGQTTDQNDEDDADKTVNLPIVEPATIKISKDLIDSEGNSSAYTDKYGAIDYILTKIDENDTEFTVYYIDTEDNNKYKRISTMTEVESATLTAGQLYYLPAGTYKVVESLSPEQDGKMAFVSVTDNGELALDPGDDWTPIFTNQEQLGSVTVRKVDKDNTNKYLQGAKFELKNKATGAVMTPEHEETNVSGIMLWTNLPYGTYVLTETQAPNGYSIIEESREVVVDADHQSVTEVFKNQSTKTKLTLEKQVASTGNYGPATGNTWNNVFTLRRSTKDPSSADFNPETDWQTVTKDYDGTTISISLSGGKWSANVEATTGDGTPYYYQFVEAIPTGYYDPATGLGGTTTSDAKKLVNDSGIVSNTTFTMYNRRFYTINIDKRNREWTSAGDKLEFTYDKRYTFKLYYYTGTMPENPTAAELDELLTLVDTQTTSTVSSNVPNRAVFSNVLPYNTGTNGAKRYYVIEELGADDYTLQLQNNAPGTVKTWAGRKFIVLNSTQSSTTVNFTATNSTRLIRVQIYKTNYYTGDSNITGTGFTIKDEDGQYATGYKADGTEITLNGQPIPFEGTTTVYSEFFIEAGQAYTFEEAYNNSVLPRPAPGNAHYSNNGTLDLSNKVITSNTVNDATVRRDIYNIPNPKVTITKKDSETGTTLTGARFKVYKNVGTEAAPVYEAVRQNGSEVIITAGSTTETIRLEPGKYYFEELSSSVPDGYLKPNDYWDEYNQLNSDPANPVCVRDETNGLTLFVGTVVNGPVGDKADNAFSFTIKNIPNKGILKVRKTVDGKSTTEQFTITATVGSTTYTAVTETTNQGAVAEFYIPVYDVTGQKITYTISESLEGQQAIDYYKSTADQYAQIEIKTDSSDTTVTTTDLAGQTLLVNNVTKISVSTSKVYRRPWEYSFINMDYPMPGATIGLYKKDGDNWVLVPESELQGSRNPQTTSTDDASVKFAGLRRDTDYAMVELASGNPNMFPYNASTGSFYPAPYYPTNTASISSAEIDNYNVRYLLSADTSVSSQKAFIRPEMVNANHWVQFHITKWLDHDVGPEGGPIIHGTEVNKQEDTKHDNAVFELYRYVVPENAPLNTNIPYPGQGWELVGSYTSGTMYDLDGDRQVGEFMTSLEQNINERYVYLLIETYPGPGAVINPNFAYTYWNATGTQYTVSITGKTLRHNNYIIDQVNSDDILDSRPVGPGTDEYYLASIRLSKWKDTINKTTGKPNKDYKPLPNVLFEVRLEDGRLLTTLTTGLDADPDHPENTEYALAQSGTFELLPETINNGTVTIRVLQLIGQTDSEGHDLSLITNVPFETFEFDYNDHHFTGYRIKTKLTEKSAPEGFGYIESPYSMYLCFVDITSAGGENWVFNDAYFVTDEENPTLSENQIGTSWFVRDVRGATTFSDGSQRYAISFGDAQSPLRIVDYPIENTMVHVRKFGYKPSSGEGGTVGKTSAELDLMATSAIDRVSMDGVSMVIEHQTTDGGWEKWNYKKNKKAETDDEAIFTTNEEGGYVFPDGLKIGVYRIYETENSLPTKWSAYEIAYNGEDYARVFTVADKAAVDVTMYNPLKITITLTKQDWAGNNLFDTISGGWFKLGSVQAQRDEEHKVFVFRNLASGEYALTESFTGYTDQYLKQYLEVTYGLEDIVDGTFLGYDYQTKGSADSNQDVVIREITPVNADHNVNVNKASITLTIKNPKTGTITLKKQGETATETDLSAGFVGYRLLFDLTSDEVLDLTGIENISAHGELKTTYLFERLESLDGSTTYDKSGLAPGIYAFIETTAPEGYSVLKTINDKPVVYYVVITGGMNIKVNNQTVTGTPDFTVTGLPTSVTLWDNSTETTLFSSDETIIVTAKNYKTVTLNAQKIVLAGSFDTCPDNWEIELKLYDGNGTNKKQVGIVKLTKSNPSGTFKVTLNGNNYSQLTKGKTYYLEETPKAHFELDSVSTPSNSSITGTNGLFPIVVDGEGIVVTVKNKWLYGKVEFKKVDKDNPDKTLPGAKFVVQHDPDGDGEYETIVDATVKETPAGSGFYVATIPLDDENLHTYRILETDPPAGYLLVDEVKLDVELSYEHNYLSTELDLKIPNTKGNQIIVKKFNNIHTAEFYLDQAPAGDAEFVLYHERSDGTWEIVEPLTTTRDIIDSETGQITKSYTEYTYVTVPYQHYAVRESWAKDTYVALEGFFTEDGTKLVDMVTVNDSGLTAYDLGDETSIVLEAYNIPKLTPVIVKKDVGGYPTGVVAGMEFYIFEIDDDFEDSSDAVETLLKEAPKDANGVFTTAIFHGETSTLYESNGTSKIWEPQDYDPAKYWNPGKRYLLVETKVMPNSQGSVTNGYNSMRKDDLDVNWYRIIEPIDDPNVSSVDYYKFILENAYGDASVKLTKAAAPTTIDSLLSDNRDITYTITPTVTSNNQMLSTFVVKENGIVAKCKDEQNPSSSELIDITTPWSYEFTSITVGKVTSHTIPQNYIDKYNLSGNDMLVSAKITFLDSENQPVGEPVDIPDLSDEHLVPVPDDAKAATQFMIEYYCVGIQKISNIEDKYFAEGENPQLAHTYSLGKDFKVDPITVNVTVKKNGSLTTVNDEILRLDNTATVDYSYPKWSQDGSSVTMEGTPITREARVNVNTIERPTVSIQKSCNLTTAKANDLATYTITVTNTSGVDFEKPVLLDILPTGVHYEEFVEVTGGTDTEIGTPSITPVKGEPSQSINQNEEGIVADSETAVIFAFNGKIKPGETITLTFKAKVSKTVTMYGETGSKQIENDVYLTSSKTTYRTNSNPQGFSFISDNVSLSQAASRLDSDGGDASLHLNGKGQDGRHGMSLALTELHYMGAGSEQYAWVAGENVIPVVAQDSISIRKAVWGDKDTGFSDADDFLGSATRSKEVTSKVGWVKWRLSIMNGNEVGTNFAVGDAIARDDDKRKTEWDVYMDRFLVVEQDNTTINSELYDIYYYTGDEDTAQAAVETALLNCRTEGWLANNGWNPEDEFTTYEEKASITAFLMVFKPTFTLAKNVTITIVYETAVPYFTDDEFTSIGFTNANNTFSIIRTTPSVTNKLTSSNIVSVTLLDDDVEVQGDLWIDEDWDGEQQSANRRDYQQYAVVQELAQATSFTIKDERHVPGTPPVRYIESMFSTPTEEQPLMFYEDGKPKTNVVEYESIVRFRFTKLGPAKEKDETQSPYVNETLNIDALKTTDPYNYTLGSTISLEHFSDVFELTSTGDGNYMSDDPDATTATVIANKKDNNFREKAEGSFDTKPFYIRYSRNVDQSKDIGVKMSRSVVITKVSQDDPSILLEGAEFQIFGPYDDEYSKEQNKKLAPTDTSTLTDESPELLRFIEVKDEEGNVLSYELSSSGTVTTLVTNSDGQIVITGLNWWKQYVVKETKAPEGYSYEGLTVSTTDTPPSTAADGKWHDEKHKEYKEAETIGNDAFLLKIPAIERTSQMSEFHVLVKDPRYVEVTLDVEKILRTLSTESFNFTFNLRLMEVNPATPLAELNAALMPAPVLDEDKNPVKFDGTNFDSDTMLYYFGIDADEKPKQYLDEEGQPNPDAIDAPLYYDNIIRTLTIPLAGNASGENKATGTFNPVVKLNGPGTYIFHIEEVKPDPLPPGWTYDSHLVKTATVKIEWRDHDPGDDPDSEADDTPAGLYVKSIEYSDQITETEGEGEDAVEKGYEKFINEYEKFGSWTPDVTKNLTGRPIVPGEFTFPVYEVIDSAETPVMIPDLDENGNQKEDANGNLLFKELIGIVTDEKNEDGTYKVVFESIPYDLSDVGTHTYIIREANAQEAGVQYDQLAVEYTVTVTDDKTQKNLVVTQSEPTDIQFDNTFSASGVWAPTVFKKIIGRDMNPGETYTVYVKEGQNVIMTGTVTAGENGVPKKFTFDPTQITYTQANLDTNYAPKTFTYTISESKENPSEGVTYSDELYTVKVTIALQYDTQTHKYSNVLSVVEDPPKPDNVYTFINTYASTGTAKIEVEKIMFSGVHENAIPLDRSFDFILYGYDNEHTENNPLKTGTATVSQPKVTFAGDTVPQLTYTLVDDKQTFTYYVKEVIPNPMDPDIMYDTHVYKVEITVNDDKHSHMIPTYKYYVSDPDSEDGWKLLSTYTDSIVNGEQVGPTYVEKFFNEKLYSLKIKKNLDDPNPDTSKRFKFTITLMNGEDPYSGVTVGNTSFRYNVTLIPDTISVDDLDWNEKEPGVYTFTLAHNEEIELKLPDGVTYKIEEAGAGYTVTVNRTKKDGTPEAVTETVDQDPKYTIDGKILVTDGDQAIVYNNQPGVNLPLTGGSGTVPFTAAGLVVLGSGLCYARYLRKKKEREDDLNGSEGF